MFSLQTPHFDTKISHMYTSVQTLPQFIPTYNSTKVSKINAYKRISKPAYSCDFCRFPPIGAVSTFGVISLRLIIPYPNTWKLGVIAGG